MLKFQKKSARMKWKLGGMGLKCAYKPAHVVYERTLIL